MKLTFYIQYKTIFGEELVLNVVTPQTDATPEKTVPYRMSTRDGLDWSYELNIAEPHPTCIEYYYSVECNGQEKCHEWTVMKHRVELSLGKAAYEIYDHWNNIPEDSYRYSAAFAIDDPETVTASHKTGRIVRLNVRAPQLGRGQRLYVVGSAKEIGAWDLAKALPMIQHNYHEWVVDIDADRLQEETIELKFVAKSKDAAIWEHGENRTIQILQRPTDTVTIYSLSAAYFDLPNDRVAGTLVPVFSLRTKGSFGVGDFGDLKTMIDYVAMTGQKALQVLPINDTTSTHTWTDSYPYSCISIFALHPQYVDLRQLPALSDDELNKKYEQLRQELNALPQIDYERVNQAKLEILRLLYEQEGKKTLAGKEFKAFFHDTEQWLVPYAFYCLLRDTHQLAGHPQWDEHDREKLTSARTRIYKEVGFYYFVQFILDKQMRAAHDHARQLGIILKGDIPIGVSRQGCDVWVEPKYFNMNGQAGAPPDDFSEDGQNWGFPTYNWDEMLKDGCRWWVRRFQNMARFFDAYRIDHVLGFFRIWEIPVPQASGLFGQFQPALPLSRQDVEAWGMPFHPELYLEDHKQKDRWHPAIGALKTPFYHSLPDWEKGRFYELYADYYYRRNNQFWYGEAMKKLPKLVEATRMLVCAEDLGMVPDCVAWVMQELRILSLEIQSMPKDPHVRFGYLDRNPYRSVSTISTHDMATLRQWWDEDWPRTQDYFNNMLHRQGPAPHPLPGWLARDIVMQHLQSPSMLCIISLQDWLAIDEQLRLADADAERINIPANPRHYWRYRMHLNIEDLMANANFTANVRELVARSGRA
ncbi:MAG: 4-alpha-glucanotransferase [Prevotella sp.]|nr:4-alpha-glucanotransferase [Prevotella sp.]